MKDACNYMHMQTQRDTQITISRLLWILNSNVSKILAIRSRFGDLFCSCSGSLHHLDIHSRVISPLRLEPLWGGEHLSHSLLKDWDIGVISKPRQLMTLLCNCEDARLELQMSTHNDLHGPLVSGKLSSWHEGAWNTVSFMLIRSNKVWVQIKILLLV